MSFKMRCPKCSSMSYTIERDTRTYTGAKSGEMVFSCRCGKQLFGEALDAEHLRQKNIWEADPERQREEREREERRREIEQREEQLKKAFEYRKAWVAQKRAEQEAARQGQTWTPPATPKPAPAAPAREPAPVRAAASKAQPAAESHSGSQPMAGSGRAQAADPGSLVASQASERLQPTAQPAGSATAAGDRAVERSPASSPTVSGTQGDAVVADPGRAPGRKPADRPQDDTRRQADAARATNEAANDESSDEGGGEAGSEMCLWEGCGNRAAPNSKYCSRACSNKNARHRHAQRKKGEQAA